MFFPRLDLRAAATRYRANDLSSTGYSTLARRSMQHWMNTDMSNNMDLGAVALDSMRKRITKFLPGQIRQAVQQLTDDELWWRPNPESNSVGNLILHVSGSIRNYLCRSVGGFDYTRDRAAEFAAKGPIPREQLLAIFEEMVEQATSTLESF